MLFSQFRCPYCEREFQVNAENTHRLPCPCCGELIGLALRQRWNFSVGRERADEHFLTLIFRSRN